MKSAAVTSRILPAIDGGISTYLATVEPADIRFSVTTSAVVLCHPESAISFSTGVTWLSLDPETARCLGEQLIAAADHYDQQTAVKGRPI